MAKSNAGGGINSNKNVSPPVRTGKTATGYTPGGVSQFGGAVGSGHTTDGKDTHYRGDPLHTKSPPAGGGQMLGNQKALDSKSAPGQGRTIHATGSQGQHGAVNPGEGGHGSSRVTGKDILSDFGPERGKR